MPNHNHVKTLTPTSTEVGFDMIIDSYHHPHKIKITSRSVRSTLIFACWLYKQSNISNINSKNSSSNDNDNNNINKEPTPICPKEQYHLAYFAFRMALKWMSYQTEASICLQTLVFSVRSGTKIFL